MKKLRAIIDRSIDLKPNELPALIISFIYFFSLLCAYYIIRPLRDEMGILGGIENLPWVFTGTFIAILAMVPLYGWISSRYPRRQFLPLVYSFFIFNLLCFYFLFHFKVAPAQIAQSFFIWVSVFNLFVVSVFWSFMNDIYDREQAKRLFGFIAAGGTIGALCGPLLTTWLAQPLGTHNLLLISAVFLLTPILCINKLSLWFKQQPLSETDDSYQKPIGGHWLAGLSLVMKSPYLMGIAVLILIYSTLSTFIYFQQASIIKDAFSNSAERTSVFAMMDLAVNSLTILIQVFLTGRIVKNLGLAWTLALIPLFLIVGFIVLSISPVISVLIVVQVLRRAGNYSIMRPAREMLYVVLGREEKYKAKNFIDTVVYRGGDAVSAWIYDGLRGVGLSLGQIAFIAAPIAALWAFIAYRLGIKQEQIALKEKRHE